MHRDHDVFMSGIEDRMKVGTDLRAQGGRRPATGPHSCANGLGPSRRRRISRIVITSGTTTAIRSGVHHTLQSASGTGGIDRSGLIRASIPLSSFRGTALSLVLVP